MFKRSYPPYDAHGVELLPGDWVRSLYPYVHIKAGSLHEVYATDNTCVTLKYKCYWRGNSYDEGRFKAINFEKVEYNSLRPPPIDAGAINYARCPITVICEGQPQTKESVMLHIAVRISGNRSLEEIVRELISHNVNAIELGLMANTSAAVIKEMVRVRINRNPEERWLICSGNTIGESASPPIRFVPV